MAQSAWVELQDTQRLHPREAKEVGIPEPEQILQLTVVVRRAANGSAESGYERALKSTGGVPDHATFASERGADRADIQKVAQHAQTQGLTVLSTSAAERVLLVEGPIRAIEQAFSVKLKLYEDHDRRYRSYEGNLSVPLSLANVVEAVFGLDDRPVARGRRHPPGTDLSISRVASAYRFPEGATGRNQVVGIIEFGGGFLSSDLAAAGIDRMRVTSVSVDGAVNDPWLNDASAEVTLDVTVVALAAPGAHLKVYFAPSTDRGMFDAFRTAVHDGAVAVVSTSWGLAERRRSRDLVRALEGLFDDAAYLRTTICAASGDDGSRDEWEGHNVDHPASSPGVLGCGGTTLTLDAAGAIADEVVWNMGPREAGGTTGGGVSTIFDRPSWQSDLPAIPGPGRGVPDVASVASGVDVVFGRRAQPFGGTSAAAPMWAALVAVLNERLGRRLGWVNPALYALAATFPAAFRDITEGNNEVTDANPPAFPAGAGWDPCTGLGTPNGEALLLGLELAERRIALRMMGPGYDGCGVGSVMPGEVARFDAHIEVEVAGSAPVPAPLPAGWSASFHWTLEPGSGGTVISPTLDQSRIEIRLDPDPTPVRLTVAATLHAVEGSASRDVTLTGHGTYLPEDNVSARFRHLVCWMQQQLYIPPPYPIGDPAPHPDDAARRLERAELERIRGLAKRLHDAADRILSDERLLHAGSFEHSTHQARAGAIANRLRDPTFDTAAAAPQ